MSSIVRQHKTIAKYQLVERLGRGGSAEVWKAYDPSLARYVAMKILNAAQPHDVAFRERFVREARVVAHLNHPNIVQVFDFSSWDETASGQPAGGGQDVAYMIMQYVEGQTLADYLRKTSQVGVFPPGQDLVSLFATIAAALAYAHARGVVHRDIKPANILLDRWNTVQQPMGEPILTDFGMVKLLGKQAETPAQGGMVVGTPLYISPEQAQGLEVTGRSDIYSLGVILYEAFTGIHPYTGLCREPGGQHTVTYLLQHVFAVPRHPSEVNLDLPQAAGDVILRGLAKDPAARFSSAPALVAALAEALALPVPEQLIPLLAAEQAAQLVSQTSTPVSSPGNLQGVEFARRLADPVTPFPETARPPGTTPPRRGTGAWQHLARKRYRRPLTLVSVGLLVVAVLAIVLSAGVGSKSLTRGATPTTPLIGTVSFISSGRGDPLLNRGQSDEVQIDLRQLPAPPAGKSDYAWLLGDANQSDGQALLLGRLSVGAQGQVSLTYPGDAEHTDLLATFSQFLVTEEDSQLTPVTPSLDKATWRYYGEIPQMPNPQDRNGFSMLDHLRHLLASDPKLNSLGLSGGLSSWLYANDKEVWALAASARAAWDAKNPVHLHRQVVRLLDYLDGTTVVGTDLPPGTPILADPHLARVGLLEFNPAADDPPGYIYHVASHLQGLDTSPGRTEAQHILALQVASALDVVRQELERARLDAKQLVQLSDAQLLAPSTLPLLNDLVGQTALAYQGPKATPSSAAGGGVVWIHAKLQTLAVIQVFPYSPPH